MFSIRVIRFWQFSSMTLPSVVANVVTTALYMFVLFCDSHVRLSTFELYLAAYRAFQHTHTHFSAQPLNLLMPGFLLAHFLENTQQRPASFPRRADLMTPPSTPKSKQLGKRRAAAAPSSHSNSALVSSVGGVASRGLADALGAISPYLSVVGGSPSLRPRVRAISDSPVHFNTSPPRPRLSNGIGKHQQLQLPKISPPADTDMSAGFASHAQPMAQAASRLPDLPEVRPPDDISNGVGHGDHMSQTSADTSGSVLSHKDGRVREFHDFISQNRYKMIIVCTVCHHANAVDKSQVYV